MEMEHIMNFLLQEESAPGAVEDLAVLPIIGPGKTGKSTLVEHASTMKGCATTSLRFWGCWRVARCHLQLRNQRPRKRHHGGGAA
jgi:hypothetical protein